LTVIGRPQKKRSETSTVEKERAQMKAPSIAHRNLPRFLGALAAVAFCILALGAGSASAALSIELFDGENTANEAGDPATQAGSHPFASITEQEFNTEFRPGAPEFKTFPVDPVKDQEVALPAGVIANPNAVPKCTEAEYYAVPFETPSCPNNTAVGVAFLEFYGGEEAAFFPVYNMVTGPNEPARLAFRIIVVNVFVGSAVRNGGDYGANVIIPNSSQGLALTGARFELWGNPADSSHDPFRGKCQDLFGSSGNCPYNPNSSSGFEPPKPFLTLPSACSGPLATTLRANSWLEPGNYDEASFLTHDSLDTPVGIEGCEKLPFDPSLKMQVDPGKADSPAALNVNLQVPQNEAPEGLASSLLKKAVVTLPQGVSVNTSAASGLEGCSEAQFGLHANEPAHCPDASKIGTAKITTPLLEEPLQGALYLAQQNANPFGSLLAGYVIAEGHGVIIKQAAKFDLNQSTGQITATFDNVPQLPFSDVELDFFGGPRSVLVNPGTCGDHTYTSALTSWSGRTVSTTSSFAIDQNCDKGGFNPSLSAGTTNAVAGAYAPFAFNVSRNEGEQNVAAIGAVLPKGELARVAGVPLCPESDALSGNCPAASQIGQLRVAVGAGPQPLWVPQPGKAPTAMYLAGPYKGEPFSVVFRVPAQAGPFDLGTVAVRAAVHVDPITAQISVSSDPLPQILQGVPIAYRQIRVGVDRPGFMLNPTNCRETAVASTIVSAAGGAAIPASRFQVGDCADLGFKPRLHTRLLGGTRRGDHPKLRAVLKANPGGANVGRVALTLPGSELLDQIHIKAVCTMVQFAADACPRGSVYGHARVWTPLLDRPLEGPVYLRNSNNKLPDLVADLHGQIDIVLSGRIDSVRGSIRTTFAAVPDAPISAFVLTMKGGKRGLLVNATDICHGVHRARIRFTGHNDRRREARPRVRAICSAGAASRLTTTDPERR
jgi:hypothetical protein